MKKTDISHTITCFRIVGEIFVQKLERVALVFPIAAQMKIELLYTNQYDVHHAVFAES